MMEYYQVFEINEEDGWVLEEYESFYTNQEAIESAKKTNPKYGGLIVVLHCHEVWAAS